MLRGDDSSTPELTDEQWKDIGQRLSDIRPNMAKKSDIEELTANVRLMEENLSSRLDDMSKQVREHLEDTHKETIESLRKLRNDFRKVTGILMRESGRLERPVAVAYDGADLLLEAAEWKREDTANEGVKDDPKSLKRKREDPEHVR